MIDPASFLLFLSAALVIAATPGPGIMFVAARTLAGGRAEGLGCTLGTGIGGLVHAAAGAAGVSALVLASAEAFTALKLAGALYLVWTGIRIWREAGTVVRLPDAGLTPRRRSGFRDGIVVEALNPKTAAFFLAFIPQFVDPAGAVALQFVLLGTISVVLNTAVDALVVLWAARIRDGAARRPRLLRRLRKASAGAMVGLGLALAAARRPAT
ncbi:LysE family translocator [Elioraea sp.]|uniref:LysE family translocator n=1 Tax=Elioraea sp. TaxID=2185103 RepID=UPI0021DE1825|nr:LysE family translocator [Elioraea sp.]GIX08429.1 MAG: RhtB family transporter [Elioraea sp.]